MSLVWLCECGKGRACTENALDHILCPQEGSWCCSTSLLLPTSAPSCRVEGSLASVAGVSAAGSRQRVGKSDILGWGFWCLTAVS